MTRSKQPKFPAHPLKSIKLQNILSFGPEGMELELKPLNVLIGANASGKSNFLEVLSLLTALPSDVLTKLRQGGAIGEWVWKGQGAGELPRLEVTLESPWHPDGLVYSLVLLDQVQRPVRDEQLARKSAAGKEELYFRRALLGPLTVAGEELHLDEAQPVLSQLKDPNRYPEITYVGRLFSQFRFYRDWNLGPHAEIRRPQRPDMPEDFLLEDASNLALVLNDLEYRGKKVVLLENLRRVWEGAKDIVVKVYGGTVQFFLKEAGLESPTPTSRLSDGTLRYMCLAAILLHPEPPPLICIEEPELGMHPDAIPVIAEMLVEASERTQLIITTHSAELVDEFSDRPESVIVCERMAQGKQMQRLDPKPLREWLEEFRLGGAWKSGVIGGRR